MEPELVLNVVVEPIRYVPVILPLVHETRVMYSRLGMRVNEARFALTLPDEVVATNSAASAGLSLSATPGDTVISMLPDVVFRSRRSSR